jgi:flagellar motility protein MotE (MotC chaperone)
MGRLPGGPLVTGSTEGHGADAKPAPASAQQPVANSEGAAITGDGQVYCSNIVDTAADARFAWQKQTIADLARDLDGRMKLLEEKTSEYKIWLQRRDEFIKRATDQLVKIYAKMKADAAAAQLVALDEETAAAVLAKLEPKTSSTILNEMDPVRAARLTGIIAGAARLNDGGKS